MIEITIKINMISDIAEFVNLCSKCMGDVLVYSGRYIIDGKSLIGIMSLDLSKPIKVEFHGDIPNEVKEGMKKFIVD